MPIVDDGQTRLVDLMTNTARKKQRAETPTLKFRAIEFVETTIHDPVRDRWEAGCDEGGVRLYCTGHPATHGWKNARWALQVRARVRTRGRSPSKRFAVGTASMSREDLLWLRALIDAALRGTL
jgi:hypothetical protein